MRTFQFFLNFFIASCAILFLGSNFSALSNHWRPLLFCSALPKVAQPGSIQAGRDIPIESGFLRVCRQQSFSIFHVFFFKTSATPSVKLSSRITWRHAFP